MTARDWIEDSGGAEGTLGGETARERRRRGQRLEALLGFLGFFAVMTLIASARAIIIGEPSILASVILVVVLVLAGFTWRARGRV